MYPDIPQLPNYKYSAEALEAEYKRAYKSILDSIVELRNTAPEEIYQREASLLRQIQVVLTQLNEYNRQWCEAEIAKAFQGGAAYALLSAGEAMTLVEAMRNVQFSMLQQRTSEAMVADTMNDLLAATQNTERRIKQIVRQVVGDVIRRNAMKRTDMYRNRREIFEGLTKAGLSEKVTKDGFVGIIDKAGRKWDVNRYAKMIAKTKLQQAHIEGVRTEGIKRGLDVAVISSHNAKDECFQFEGMLISLNGLTEGLLTYAELYRSNLIFHPNCQHSVHLVKIENLPAAVLDKHRKKVASISNPKLKARVKPLEDIRQADRDKVRAYAHETDRMAVM